MDSKLIALFPLPNVVGMPGQSLQLHVFEPRYRQLVKHCQDSGDWVGVPLGTLVKKVPMCASVEEYLRSNQENYRSSNVFGAGPMTVLQELADGRFRIKVDFQERFVLQEVLRQLPFQLVKGTLVKTEEMTEKDERVLLKDLATLAAQVIDSPKIPWAHEALNGTGQFQSALSEFLKRIVLHPQSLQKILEEINPFEQVRLLKYALFPEQNQDQVSSSSAQEGLPLEEPNDVVIQLFRKAKGECLNKQ